MIKSRSFALFKLFSLLFVLLSLKAINLFCLSEVFEKTRMESCFIKLPKTHSQTQKNSNNNLMPNPFQLNRLPSLSSPLLVATNQANLVLSGDLLAHFLFPIIIVASSVVVVKKNGQAETIFVLEHLGRLKKAREKV